MRVLAVLLMVLAGLTGSLRGQGLTSCPPPDPSAGVGAIVGQVVDAQNQVPLGFAQIRLLIQGVEAPLEARSNTSGQFQFCSIPSGLFTLSGQLGQLGALLGPLRLDSGNTLSLSLELAAASTELETGTLTGVVMDAESMDPIEGAEVLLPGFGQIVITNVNGRFTFPSLPPGPVEIQAARLGYARSFGEVEVKYARTVHTRIALSTEPVALDPIIVTAVRRRIEMPGLEDFERRVNSGWGKFVLEDEIQRRRPMRLTDVLRETGVDVLENGRAVVIRRTGCGPTVYIDDIRVTFLPRSKSLMGAGAPKPPVTHTVTFQQPKRIEIVNPAQEAADAINNLVHPMDVIAVEIYRGPAETPGQYIDSNSQCGVILIWTRRGNISGR